MKLEKQAFVALLPALTPKKLEQQAFVALLPALIPTKKLPLLILLNGRFPMLIALEANVCVFVNVLAVESAAYPFNELIVANVDERYVLSELTAPTLVTPDCTNGMLSAPVIGNESDGS